MSDLNTPVDPKVLDRLDATPGSLGKVTLFAAFTLGVAAYVSVRKWLATRAAANEADGSHKHVGGAFRSHKSAVGSSSAVAGKAGGAAGTSDDGAQGHGSGGGPSASPPPRPQLPPRNYFTIRASLHVKRHNAKLMEWFDDQLGVQLPFSPQWFELKQEERQAPLVLLTFRTLRESSHRMAVTLEELYEPQTAAAYCEASLGRIADCAQILGTPKTRVGSKDYPAVEYCYVDEEGATNYGFSVFVVHERLAVTLQYVAPTRVRNVMPTAFYNLIRHLAFAAPSPSPSYLLVSEPRLGLGYHLPLDFLVHEGLAESDGVEDRLFTSSGGGPLSPPESSGSGGCGVQPLYHTTSHGATPGSLNSDWRLPQHHTRRPPATGAVGGEGEWAVPYATAMSRGGRRLGLITAYEPAVGSSSVSGGVGSLGDAAVSIGGGSSSGVPYMWRVYLEQQVCKAVRQLGLVIGTDADGNGGIGGGPRVVFQAPDPSDAAAYASAAQTLLVEPYPLTVALTGNFSTGEDESDAVNVTAFSLFREVRIDVNSSYVTLVPDALDAAGPRMAGTGHNASGAAATTVKAYWSAFYVPVGTACVSFHFIASALRHSSTEFVSFCAAVMNSISLGNHYGQSVSVLYCNTRHDVLPFRLSLPPTGMAIVEEPMLADPLCVVQATYGVEKISVTVRVFPLFLTATNTVGATTSDSRGGANTPSAAAAAANGAANNSAPRLATPTTGALDGRSTSPGKPLLLRPAERRGTRQRSVMRQLQFMIRYYLAQFPGGVHLVSYSRTTVNSMPALQLCFQPLRYAGGGAAAGEAAEDGNGGGGVNNWDDFGGGMGGGGSSQGTSDWAGAREAMLEEEVGQLNPFAQYFTPPPPPASYLWPPAQPQPGSDNSSNVTAAAVKKAGGGGAATADGDATFAYVSRPGADSQRSQEELDNPLRVAIAVCCEGSAFLFQTSASEYTLGVAQQAVLTMATYLAPIPRSG